MHDTNAGRNLTGIDLTALTANSTSPFEVDAVSLDLMERSWKTATSAAERRQVYGRTTGVGANREVQIDQALEQDLRLLRSHATGAGPHLSHDIVRTAMIVRLNQLLAGGSGMHPDIVEALSKSLSHDDLPRVHASSAVGTADLSQFAEIALGLMGEVDLESGRRDQLWRPHPGDALALISTNAMGVARGIAACRAMEHYVAHYEAVAALSLIATRGSTEAFDEFVHASRPQPHQASTAARIRTLVGDHQWTPRRVQDSYGFRALPQVLGPAQHALESYSAALDIELNSAAENPVISVDRDDVFHNANFHAQALALACDHSKLALFGVANLSTRRLANLTEPAFTDLDPFLAVGPAGSSGVMLLEYVAAGALARSRNSANPATLGTVTISRGTEDHASFHSQAIDQLQECIQSAREVLGCELVAAVRALRILDVSLDPETPLGTYLQRVSSVLDPNCLDRPLTQDLENAVDFLTQSHGLKGI
ncbi:aromatic amino acid ammonia-lyase [Rhodococcus sp. NPDC127528]|uniref:aromatic amino acid ammonia-lyase n=1 Tax=unclassified Rhodococcus (in: high G+C Gram-positive bacteria) TaxID=192944 RepID=UPI00362E0767